MKKLSQEWIDRLPKWFWKLPFVWRLRYDFYHEQFITPVSTKKLEKTLPYVKYDAQESGDIVWNPYASHHFRCPYCGQAHELLFTYEAENLRLKQDPTMTKLWVERARHGCIDSDAEGGPMFKHYTAPLTNMIQITCHDCRETAPKWRWTHAYQNPLLYFQTENICHCGGELFLEPDVFGNHHLTCEKCNWIKPGSKISGAEGDDT